MRYNSTKQLMKATQLMHVFSLSPSFRLAAAIALAIAPLSARAGRRAPAADSAAELAPQTPPLQIDDAKAAAAGIQKLSSQRLVLYTDLPLDDEVRGLPAIFDQAFPQWCRYFGLDPRKHADWRMTGFLMKDKARFTRTGLLPADLPPFLHGYSRNQRLWLYEQPSDYYRRHLLLHEGTHGFMNTLLGGCGPPWYMEGIAELLGTHRLEHGRLTLGVMPADRDEVPEWGRIRIIKKACAEHRGHAADRHPRLCAVGRDRALCLVLGAGRHVGPASALSRSLPPASRGDSAGAR